MIILIVLEILHKYASAEILKQLGDCVNMYGFFSYNKLFELMFMNKHYIYFPILLHHYYSKLKIIPKFKIPCDAKTIGHFLKMQQSDATQQRVVLICGDNSA